MKQRTLRLIAELSVQLGQLGAEVRRTPDDAETPALEAAELVLRDGAAGVQRVLAALRQVHAEPSRPIAPIPCSPIVPPYSMVGMPQDDGY